MKIKIKKQFPFSKVGINEIDGLKKTMLEIMVPLQKKIKDHVYWNACELEEVEYTSRDGFIAHSHNCGGIMLDLIIPKCKEYNFDFLEFGEHDDNCTPGESGECTCGEDEGHLDARLRIWLKFEGINDEGEMNFYLTCSGGNGDAPYFRERHLGDIFEKEFTAKTLREVKKKGTQAIKNLIKEFGWKN